MQAKVLMTCRQSWACASRIFQRWRISCRAHFCRRQRRLLLLLLLLLRGQQNLTVPFGFSFAFCLSTASSCSSSSFSSVCTRSSAKRGRAITVAQGDRERLVQGWCSGTGRWSHLVGYSLPRLRFQINSSSSSAYSSTKSLHRSQARSSLFMPAGSPLKLFQSGRLGLVGVRRSGTAFLQCTAS